MKDLFIIAVSPAALALYALALILVWRALAAWKPWIVRYENLVYEAFNAAEKLIPDDTQNKALAKLDYFLKAFRDGYKRQTGKEPSDKQLEQARGAAEKLVYEKNRLRK